MKKICLILLMFFSFCFVTMASEVEVSFSDNFKTNYKLNANVNETISVPIYYKANDFDLYALLTDLEYDKEHLELIDYKEESGFTITIGNKLLADRLGTNFKESGKVVTLNFKVKTKDKTTISLKNIMVADTKEQLNLENALVTINSLESNNIIYIVGGIMLVTATISLLYLRIEREDNI